jgi:hypothetical protein
MKYICFAAVMISLQDALIQVAYYPWGQILIPYLFMLHL